MSKSEAMLSPQSAIISEVVAAVSSMDTALSIAILTPLVLDKLGSSYYHPGPFLLKQWAILPLEFRTRVAHQRCPDTLGININAAALQHGLPIPLLAQG